MMTQQTAQLFFKHVWKHYGLSTTIIADRDGSFFNTFWQNLWQQLNTRLSLSTTFHLQIDRHMEVVNHLVVQLLRMYNHKNHRTWDESSPYIDHGEIFHLIYVMDFNPQCPFT